MEQTAAAATQSCLTLCDPMDYSPPGFSVHGIFQARILERVVMPSSRGSSWPRDWSHISCVSCIADRFFTHWAIREAHGGDIQRQIVVAPEFLDGVSKEQLGQNEEAVYLPWSSIWRASSYFFFIFFFNFYWNIVAFQSCAIFYYRAAAAKSLQLCPTLRPHRRQPTRLPRPWDSPGKNAGVGCHFLLQCMKVKS